MASTSSSDNTPADEWRAANLPNFPRLDTPPMTPLPTLQRDYRFCSRCWLPTAPVCRCTCSRPTTATQTPEHATPDAPTPAQVANAHPALRQIASAVQSGAYADDTATREQRWLGWLRWLYARRVVGEHAVWTYEVVVDEAPADTGADACE